MPAKAFTYLPFDAVARRSTRRHGTRHTQPQPRGGSSRRTHVDSKNFIRASLTVLENPIKIGPDMQPDRARKVRRSQTYGLSLARPLARRALNT